MTDLLKPVSRRSHGTIFEKSKERRVIVTLIPPNVLTFRLERTKGEYALTAEKCFQLAVEASVQADKRRKAEEKKARTSAKGG
jgi:hypothetical protein